MINFPDYGYFNDVDIAYLDFIQRITSVINRIAPFKEIRVKSYSHDWFDGEILDKVILRDKRLKKFKDPRLNIDDSCIKKQKQMYTNLLKTKKETSTKKNWGKMLASPRSYESP